MNIKSHTEAWKWLLSLSNISRRGRFVGREGQGLSKFLGDGCCVMPNDFANLHHNGEGICRILLVFRSRSRGDLLLDGRFWVWEYELGSEGSFRCLLLDLTVSMLGVPCGARTCWRVSGRPDCWISSDVALGSVTQQSISEFAIVKVFAKLPNNSTFAAIC